MTSDENMDCILAEHALHHLQHQSFRSDNMSWLLSQNSSLECILFYHETVEAYTVYRIKLKPDCYAIVWAWEVMGIAHMVESWTSVARVTPLECSLMMVPGSILAGGPGELIWLSVGLQLYITLMVDGSRFDPDRGPCKLAHLVERWTSLAWVTPPWVHCADGSRFNPGRWLVIYPLGRPVSWIVKLRWNLQNHFGRSGTRRFAFIIYTRQISVWCWIFSST